MSLRDVAVLLQMLHVMSLRDVSVLLQILCVTQGCFCVVTDFVCHSGMLLCCYRFCVSLRDVAVLLQILCVSQGCCCVVTDFVCLSGMLLCLLQRLVCMVSCCRVWLVTEGCCCLFADFSLSPRDVSKFSTSLREVAMVFQSLACHSGMLLLERHSGMLCCCRV